MKNWLNNLFIDIKRNSEAALWSGSVSLSIGITVVMNAFNITKTGITFAGGLQGWINFIIGLFLALMGIMILIILRDRKVLSRLLPVGLAIFFWGNRIVIVSQYISLGWLLMIIGLVLLISAIRNAPKLVIGKNQK